MIVIAHRGANREALENSFSAFERAIEVGAQRLEIDVLVAKDGSVVVAHDDNLARVTGVSKKVSKLTREDLKSIKLTNGEPLPFLEECLDRFLPRVEINIEVKPRSEMAVSAITKIVNNHPLRDKIIVSSFYSTPLTWVLQEKIKVRTACLWGWMDVADWPLCLANVAPQVMMEKCQTHIFHPYAPFVSEHLMDAARYHGWEVYPWYSYHSAEDFSPEREWENMYSLGVDGICTNYPRQLAMWLQEVQDSERLVG